MTLPEILTEARKRLSDTKTPYLWDDTEIYGYLNEAINEVSAKKRLFRDSKTAAICQIALLAADASPDYVYDTRITEIVTAKMRSQVIPLRRTNKADMDAWYPNWRNAPAGTPSWRFLTDFSEGYLTLFPKSSIDDTIDLTVYRLPLVQMSAATPAPTLELNFQMHPRLFNGILCRAYLKEDTETLDPEKAAKHLVLWKVDMDEMARLRIRMQDSGAFLGPNYGAI